MKYNIIVWPRRSSQLTFKELADSFAETLSKQFPCTKTSTFCKDSDTINIVFGSNDSLFLPLEIPPNSIIVNLEQLGKDQYWNHPKYIEILKTHPVWDYTDVNINYLKSIGIENIKKINVGYTKSLEIKKPINPVVKTIDVLFYGALNERRTNIYYKLKELGIKVLFSSNSFGEERDKLILASKIVLNIHYYDSKILEVVRISHLLANKKCVISERGSEDSVNNIWGKGVVMCDYDDIVSKVLIYLANDKKIEEQEKRAFKFIKNYSLTLPI